MLWCDGLADTIYHRSWSIKYMVGKDLHLLGRDVGVSGAVSTARWLSTREDDDIRRIHGEPLDAVEISTKQSVHSDLLDSESR